MIIRAFTISFNLPGNLKNRLLFYTDNAWPRHLINLINEPMDGNTASGFFFDLHLFFFVTCREIAGYFIHYLFSIIAA